jgi:hypothetical protein
MKMLWVGMEKLQTTKGKSIFQRCVAELILPFSRKTDFFFSGIGKSIKSVPRAMLFIHVSANKKIYDSFYASKALLLAVKVKIPLHHAISRRNQIKIQKNILHVTTTRERPNYSIPLGFFANQTKKYVTNRGKNTHIQSQAEFLGESRLVSSY